MHASHHEHTPDMNSFLSATQMAVDLEYDYVIQKVGLETLLRDADNKKMARLALSLLNEAGLEAVSEFEDNAPTSGERERISDSDEASLDYLRVLASNLGSINGYTLTMISADELILNQLVRTKDDCLITISLDVKLSPIGIHVAKDRYMVLPGRAPMKDPLEVGPEDTAIIDAFVQKIIDIR